MKTREMAKKGLYIGAGAGLVLFAIIGLLPGSFIGGVIGLNIAGSIFGTPVSSAVLPRIIVGASMVFRDSCGWFRIRNRHFTSWLACRTCNRCNQSWKGSLN